MHNNQDIIRALEDLRKTLRSNKGNINVKSSIASFLDIIEKYNSKPDLDEELLFYKETWSQIQKSIYEENKHLDHRIKKLKKVALLVELGVCFDNDELQVLVA